MSEKKSTKKLSEIMEQLEHNTSQSENKEEYEQTVEPHVIPPSVSSGLEDNAVYRSLTNEQKERLLSGRVDPDADEFDSALQNTQMSALEEINSLRESRGLGTVKTLTEASEQLRDEADDDEDVVSFRRQMDRIGGDETDEDEAPTTDEEDQEVTEEERIKRLKKFERQLENSIPIFFDEPGVNQSKTAPTQFTIDHRTEYVETVKSVLDANGIKFNTKKKGGLKKGLMRSFIQRHPHVTMPLINSGFHVTLSGAPIPEIIQMNNMTAKKRSEAEMKKLGFIKKHLVDTSLGRHMSLSQFAQLVYYKDIQTLYFNLFIGSFPENNEFPVTCEDTKCGQDLKLNIHAADMVLNADQFRDQSDYILYKNTDISQVLAQSAVSKEKRVLLPNGLVVGFRNPTIWDFIVLNDTLEEMAAKTDLTKYSSSVGYLLYINYIAIPDEDGLYVKYDSIEEMLELLSMDEDSLDVIDEQIDEYANKDTVRYGLRAYKCPKCGKQHKEKEIDMANFLFILSQSYLAMREISKLKKKEEVSLSSGRSLNDE